MVITQFATVSVSHARISKAGADSPTDLSV